MTSSSRPEVHMREFTGVIWRIANSLMVLWFWGKICSSKGMNIDNGEQDEETSTRIS
ncbi:Hypothetical predicted protein [Paramuricea clavata]|uniref:Uncharacterized protein n=1 Tax=Paramuricea clavata TaxID=317549 RepID=A0A6S7GJB5_PARCT|nr:Hypothetical predicted protein [Paramuricea clavata]